MPDKVGEQPVITQARAMVPENVVTHGTQEQNTLPEGHALVTGTAEERLELFEAAVERGDCMKNMGKAAIEGVREQLVAVARGDGEAIKNTSKQLMENQKAARQAIKERKEQAAQAKPTTTPDSEKKPAIEHTSEVVKVELVIEDIEQRRPLSEKKNVSAERPATEVVDQVEVTRALQPRVATEIFVPEVIELLRVEAEQLQPSRTIIQEVTKPTIEQTELMDAPSVFAEEIIQHRDAEVVVHAEEVAPEVIESLDVDTEIHYDAELPFVEQTSELLDEADTFIETDGELQSGIEMYEVAEVSVAERIEELLAAPVVPITPVMPNIEAQFVELTENAEAIAVEPAQSFTERLDVLIDEVVPEAEQPVAHELLEQLHDVILEEIVSNDEIWSHVADAVEAEQLRESSINSVSPEVQAVLEELQGLLKLDDPELAKRIVLQIREEIMAELMAAVEPWFDDGMHEILDLPSEPTGRTLADSIHRLIGRVAVYRPITAQV